MSADPVIVAAHRTAVGTAGSAFADVDVIGLAAPVLAHAAGTDPVDEVILGNCLGPGGNIARVAALAAGLGIGTPGLTVDRQCASGLEAIAQGARLVASGAAGRVLVGGVESASTAPWRMWPPVDGGTPQRYTRAPFAPPGFPDPDMGAAADELARQRGFSRQRLDDYAALSHFWALAAAQGGAFDAEIVAVHGISRDQRPRPGLTAQRLGRLPSAFTKGGGHTAGNSCGISDGAAVVTIVADAPGVDGLAIRAVRTVGCDPALPGAGAAAAIAELLRHTRIDVTQLEAVEVTEAFAAVPLVVIDDLGVDPHRVCPEGGAIGYGHPWGASGAILVVRLFSQLMRRPAGSYGVAACAVGGGLGMAMLVQRMFSAGRA